MKRLLSLLVLLCLPALGQAPIRVVRNLAALDGWYPSIGQPAVSVLGYTTPGDWGPAREFRWDSTSTASTNDVCRVTTTGVGRWIHDWDGDVRAFGAIPYRPTHTLAPWGYATTNSAVASSNFTVWVQADLPATYTQPVGLFEISPIQATNYNTAVISSFGLRASPENWGFVFRSTAGSSSAGSTTNDAAVLDSTPAALSAYAGQTVDIVITRSGTNAVVYFNGTDVTHLFTFSNPLGWSKSLAQGNDLLVQVGNNVNPWYWPKPVRRFAFWASALSAGQSATPSSVSGKAIDYTPPSVVEPPDLTDRINAAEEYSRTVGGSRIVFPPGVYRVGGNVRIGQRNWWQGSGSSPYPSVFNQAFRPGATILWSYFSGTNAIFKGDLSQGDQVCLSLRSSALGNVHSVWLRSKISDMVLVGDMSQASEGVFLDRVAAVEIKDVSFYGIPGHPIRVYAGNNIKISNCDSGNMGKGLDLRGCADIMVQECFFDSPRGPALRWYCNLSKAINNTFEVSQNPRTSSPAYENPTSVDTATDEFYATNYYGHFLVTGQPVRFDAGDGVLPSPITNNVDYYAIVTGKNTFKVSTTYAAEDTQTGAFYGNGVVDITTTGSTTTNWYSGVAQSFNFLISGDHNLFIGNHGQQGYDGGMLLEGGPTGNVGGNNSIIGNSFILSGYLNPNSNAVAGLVLRDSDYNLVANNQLDDRDNTAYSQNGVIADANSIYNQFIGNSWNVDNPYTLGSPYRNTILDAQYAHLSAGNVYMSDGVSGSSTNTYYAVRANNASAPRWNANDGTLTATNNGTGQRLVSLDSPYSAGIVRVQVSSTNSGQAPEFRMVVNNATNSGTYAPPGQYKLLAAIQFGAYRGTTINDESIGAGIEAYTDSEQWTNGRLHSQLNLSIAPTNSATRLSALQVQFPNASTTNDTPLILGKFNGSQWLPSSSGFRVTIGTNDSAGSGFRILRVPNN